MHMSMSMSMFMHMMCMCMCLYVTCIRPTYLDAQYELGPRGHGQRYEPRGLLCIGGQADRQVGWALPSACQGYAEWGPT